MGMMCVPIFLLVLIMFHSSKSKLSLPAKTFFAIMGFLVAAALVYFAIVMTLALQGTR